MTALTQLSTLSRLDNVRSQMERIWQEMDQALGGILPVHADHVFTKGTFVPAIELFIKDKELVASVELPGFELQDVNVTVDERQLVISGERKRTEAVNEDGYHHTERFYGKFSRTIMLPAAVDFNAVKAVFEKGILTVRMPLAGAPAEVRKQVVIEAK